MGMLKKQKTETAMKDFEISKTINQLTDSVKDNVSISGLGWMYSISMT